MSSIDLYSDFDMVEGKQANTKAREIYYDNLYER